MWPVPAQTIWDRASDVSDPNVVQEKPAESMFVLVGSLDDLRPTFTFSQGILVFRLLFKMV